MKKLLTVLMIVGLLAAPSAAYADINQDADYGDYFQKVPAMMYRGFVNTVTSPGYFFGSICDSWKEEGFASKIEMPVAGIGQWAAAGVGGMWDIATAVIPEYRGAGYKRGMFPDYLWETPAS